MFDDEIHKNAIKDFIAFLRTITTQKNIAFFSDVSREYVRHLGKGDQIPTIRVFFNIIESAGLDLKEGAALYVDFLEKQKAALAADNGKGLNYIKRIRPKKDSAKKKDFFKELRAIAKENEMTLVGEDQYDYYESWINPVLRELVPQVPEATPAQMADMLAFDTQAAEVKKALKLLQKVGLLNMDANGKFEQSSKAITTGNIEVANLSVREMHRQMGELAVRSLDEVPMNERDISGLTLGVSEDAYYRITKEIEDFRRRVASIVMQDTDEDRVYRLNVQLFPLTKKIKKGEKNV